MARVHWESINWTYDRVFSMSYNCLFVYGKSASGKCTARKWFFCFNESHFNTNSSARSLRSSHFDKNDEAKTKVITEEFV